MAMTLTLICAFSCHTVGSFGDCEASSVLINISLDFEDGHVDGSLRSKCRTQRRTLSFVGNVTLSLHRGIAMRSLVLGHRTSFTRSHYLWKCSMKLDSAPTADYLNPIFSL